MSLSECEIPRVYSVQNQVLGSYFTPCGHNVRTRTSVVSPAVTVMTASGFVAVSASNP